MKVNELRVLEADELGDRLRTARRELYELRFKHAVGQLENASQIKKVRHDIARIMTVQRERDFGIVASPHEEFQPAATLAEAGSPDAVAEEELVEQAPAKPKRSRKTKTEKTEESA